MTVDLSERTAELLIIGASVIGILFGLVNAIIILSIKVINPEDTAMALKEDKHLQSL